MTRVDVRVGPVRFHGWRAFLYWLCAALVVLTVRAIRWSVGRPRTTCVLLGLSAVVWAAVEHPVATAAGVGVLSLLGLWSPLLAPASWRRRAHAWWRSVWLYRRKWRTAMRVAGLARVDERGRFEVPRLGRVRCTASTDLVRVRGLLGQRFAEFEQAAPMLAHVFGATGFVVHRGDDRRLTLELVRGVVGRSWNREGSDLGADL